MKINEKKTGLSSELHRLVSKLVDEYGYSLSQTEWVRIIEQEHYDADDFALDILAGDGLSVGENQSSFRRIKALFVEKFGHSVHITDFNNSSDI